jgi:hypothetical protein
MTSDSHCEVLSKAGSTEMTTRTIRKAGLSLRMKMNIRAVGQAFLFVVTLDIYMRRSRTSKNACPTIQLQRMFIRSPQMSRRRSQMIQNVYPLQLCIGHWFPACAGMTRGVKGFSGWLNKRSEAKCGSIAVPKRRGPPRRHSQIIKNVCPLQLCIGHWFPACAGMTRGVKGFSGSLNKRSDAKCGSIAVPNRRGDVLR